MYERSDADPQAQLSAALAEVWTQSKELMLQRVRLLEDAAGALLEGALEPDLRVDAEREAHKLAGSLGTFGLSEGTRLAKEIEWLLQGSKDLDPEALHLSELVVGLLRQVESDPVAETVPQTSDDDTENLILIVDADPDFAHRVIEEGTSQGISVTAVSSPASAAESIAVRRPNLVLLDPGSGAALSEGRAFLEKMGKSSRGIPTVVLSPPGSGVDRGETARLGGKGYLSKPMPPKAVIEAAARTLDRLRKGSKILVVDDDPMISAILKPMLRNRGFRVEALQEPEHFWEALEKVRPELLVLDFEFPQMDGLELCRMVRNDTAWAQLPIVFLTGHSDAASERQMFAAGADDVVAKPIVIQDLAVRITNRIQRTRQFRELTEIDPRTGLAGWRGFVRETEGLVALAGRYAKPFALVQLEVDQLSELEGKYGREGGAAAIVNLGRLLRRSFHTEDALGVHKESQLFLGLYGHEPGGAIDRLARVLETFRNLEAAAGTARFRATASAGIAWFPKDGLDVLALSEAAGAALKEAQAVGGNRIQATGQESQTAATVDVLIVDDDDALASLLIQALTTRGYRVQWVNDGKQAASMLGPQGEVRAKVVLLDVGLPGLDGLSVLRELSDNQTLASTRVIMLTLRSGEQEVLKALELGAFDHVAKPFSVPVLLQRIRSALESLP